ncbi:hypothetical protein ACH95_06160 [Bacillus glycinifermentans]|nr:hypothetical protein ACH95_06160 [Bacillus glycinifermentans]
MAIAIAVALVGPPTDALQANRISSSRKRSTLPAANETSEIRHGNDKNKSQKERGIHQNDLETAADPYKINILKKVVDEAI